MSESETFWSGRESWQFFEQVHTEGYKIPGLRILAEITKPIQTGQNHYDVFNPVNGVVFSSTELWRCMRFVEDHFKNGTWETL